MLQNGDIKNNAIIDVRTQHFLYRYWANMYNFSIKKNKSLKNIPKSQ